MTNSALPDSEAKFVMARNRSYLDGEERSNAWYILVNLEHYCLANGRWHLLGTYILSLRMGRSATLETTASFTCCTKEAATSGDDFLMNAEITFILASISGLKRYVC